MWRRVAVVLVSAGALALSLSFGAAEAGAAPSDAQPPAAAAPLARPAHKAHRAPVARTPARATSGGPGRANATGAAIEASAAPRAGRRAAPLVTNQPTAGQPVSGRVVEPSAPPPAPALDRVAPVKAPPSAAPPVTASPFTKPMTP